MRCGICEICACCIIPRAESLAEFPSGILSTRGAALFPKFQLPLTHSIRGPTAVAQISCDVTHHSGVFTARYASQRGSSHSLPFFPKCVWSLRGRAFPSVAGLQHACVTGDDLFKHVLLRTQTAPALRQRRTSKLPRVEEWMKTPPRSRPSITPHLQSLMGFVAIAQRLHSQLQENDYLLSPCQKDDGAAAQLKQHFP